MRFFSYLFLLAVSLLPASASVGQKPSRSEPPVPTHIVMPTYPQLARIHRVSGAVLVDVTLGADGRVTEAAIVSGPELLRNNARKAALISRFEPLKGTDGVRSVRLTFIFHEPSYSPPAKKPDFTCSYQIEVESLAVSQHNKRTRLRSQ
jgi:TonB family protein